MVWYIYAQHSDEKYNYLLSKSNYFLCFLKNVWFCWHNHGYACRENNSINVFRAHFSRSSQIPLDKVKPHPNVYSVLLGNTSNCRHLKRQFTQNCYHLLSHVVLNLYDIFWNFWRIFMQLFKKIFKIPLK